MEQTVLNNLKKRTRVYENSQIVASPLTWSVSECVAAYRSGSGEWSLVERDGFALWGFIHPNERLKEMCCEDLPVEFFNHQLMEYDAGSPDDVRRFVEDWGFPFLPFRYLANAPAADGYLAHGEVSRAIEETMELRQLALALSYTLTYGEGDDEAGAYGDWMPTPEQVERYSRELAPDRILADAISAREAALSLRTLQDAVRAIMAGVKDGVAVNARHLDAINMGAAHPLQLHWSDAWSAAFMIQHQYSFLTSAICNQLLDAFADSIPWRECACEECGILFKRRQGNALKPTSDSIYCSSTCKERQKYLNRLKRKEA